MGTLYSHNNYCTFGHVIKIRNSSQLQKIIYIWKFIELNLIDLILLFLILLWFFFRGSNMVYTATLTHTHISGEMNAFNVYHRCTQLPTEWNVIHWQTASFSCLCVGHFFSFRSIKTAAGFKQSVQLIRNFHNCCTHTTHSYKHSFIRRKRGTDSARTHNIR